MGYLRRGKWIRDEMFVSGWGVCVCETIGTPSMLRLIRRVRKGFFLSFYEWINREVKRIHIYGCRWNERLKAKTEGSTRLWTWSLKNIDSWSSLRTHTLVGKGPMFLPDVNFFRMLTLADVSWRMMTYPDVCWRMLTYASKFLPDVAPSSYDPTWATWLVHRCYYPLLWCTRP